jgi:antitoxin component of MazEF toxin-antitoxin module
MEYKTKQFTITKKIAKHGKQAVIIIPTMLQEQLPHGSLVEVKIEIISD